MMNSQKYCFYIFLFLRGVSAFAQQNEGDDVRPLDSNHRSRSGLSRLQPDTTLHGPDADKFKVNGETIFVNDKKLEYDSDDPENAPWRKSNLSVGELEKVSKAELSKFDSSLSTADINIKAPAVDPQTLKKEIENVSSAMRDERFNKNARTFDSLYSLKNKLEELNLQQELLGAQKVYSDKYIQKLYDSLGLKKAVSLFQVAKKFPKTEIPKDDLLNRLNTGMDQKHLPEGIGYDKESGRLESSGVDQLNSLPGEIDQLKDGGRGMMKEMDLSKVKLPVEELVELPPLPGLQVNTGDMPVIDSLREVAMKAKNIRLDENQLTDELKRSALAKKLSFFDKSYFEGILGVVNDTTFTIVQISPSLGYHFTKDLSIGLGPVLSVEYQQKKINAVIGFRSFIKGEFWKQRGYLQFEDNARPALSGIENIRNIEHSLLAGGGGLLPISDKLAINLGIFYRINQDHVQRGGSPWVFRIGLSSIKKTGRIK